MEDISFPFVFIMHLLTFIFQSPSPEASYTFSTIVFIALMNCNCLSSFKILAILIPVCDSSSLVFHVMYSAFMVYKQGDNIQPWCTPFPIWNQCTVPCMVLTVASWPTHRFLRLWVRWSGIPISLRIFQLVVIHTFKDFSVVNETEVVFLEFPCFFYDAANVDNLISGSSAFSKLSSLEKTMMLRKTEDKKIRGRQRMTWLDNITNSIGMNLSKLQEIVEDRGAWHDAVYGVTKSQTRLSNWTKTTLRFWTPPLPFISKVPQNTQPIIDV